MDISKVKYNLNRKVRLVLDRHYVDAEYILTGCILRKQGYEFYYQAELKDINNHSLVIANLDSVYEEALI